VHVRDGNARGRTHDRRHEEQEIHHVSGDGSHALTGSARGRGDLVRPGRLRDLVVPFLDDDLRLDLGGRQLTPLAPRGRELRAVVVVPCALSPDHQA
jgi:hypothetical protein